MCTKKREDFCSCHGKGWKVFKWKYLKKIQWLICFWHIGTIFPVVNKLNYKEIRLAKAIKFNWCMVLIAERRMLSWSLPPKQHHSPSPFLRKLFCSTIYVQDLQKKHVRWVWNLCSSKMICLKDFDVETKRDMDSTCTTSVIAFFYFTWAELYIGADQRACKNGSPLRHLHTS